MAQCGHQPPGGPADCVDQQRRPVVVTPSAGGVHEGRHPAGVSEADASHVDLQPHRRHPVQTFERAGELWCGGDVDFAAQPQQGVLPVDGTVTL